MIEENDKFLHFGLTAYKLVTREDIFPPHPQASVSSLWDENNYTYCIGLSEQ